MASSATGAATLHLVRCPHVPHARCGTLRVPLDRTHPGTAHDRHPCGDCIHAGTRRCRCSARSSRCRAVPATRPAVPRQLPRPVPTRCSVATSSCWWTTGGPATRARSTARSSSPTGGTTSRTPAPADGSSARPRPTTARRTPPTIWPTWSRRSASTGSICTAIRTGRSSARCSRCGTPTCFARSCWTAPIRSLGPDPWYRDTNRALRAAFRRACRRDPGCAAVPGGPILRMRRLATALRRHPIVGTAFDADGVLPSRHGRRGRVDHVRDGRRQQLRPVPRAGSRDPRLPRAGPRHPAAAAPGRREPLLLRRRRLRTPSPRASTWRRTATTPRCRSTGTRRSPCVAVSTRPRSAACTRTDPGAFAPFTIDEWLSAPLSGVQPYDSCILWPRPSRREPAAAAASGVPVGPRAGPVGRPGLPHLTGGRSAGRVGVPQRDVRRRPQHGPHRGAGRLTGGARRRSSCASCGRSPPATRRAHGPTTRCGSSTGSR